MPCHRIQPLTEGFDRPTLDLRLAGFQLVLQQHLWRILRSRECEDGWVGGADRVVDGGYGTRYYTAAGRQVYIYIFFIYEACLRVSELRVRPRVLYAGRAP